ncbi:MAG TPA: hypothetical protein VM285_14670 [Polyangia bacterium]|nr:hypothetical protein [Polyangia bacterium]
MRRRSGLFALIDVAFLADPKWRKLAVRLPEPRDFNSAVGAWLLVLTAARRNGLPDISVIEEVGDATFIPDLIAVGLLCETGIPEKPFREWAPRRPSYPSDRAPSAPKAPSAPETPITPTPLLSSTPSSRDTTNEEVRPLASNGLSLDKAALDGLEKRTGRPASTAGAKQLDEYDRLVQDHGLPKVLAALDRVRAGKTMTARQLIWPAMRILEPFPDVKGVPSAAAEEATKVRDRRTSETIWKRREEHFRFTGEWDDAGGVPPK